MPCRAVDLPSGRARRRHRSPYCPREPPLPRPPHAIDDGTATAEEKTKPPRAQTERTRGRRAKQLAVEMGKPGCRGRTSADRSAHLRYARRRGGARALRSGHCGAAGRGRTPVNGHRADTRRSASAVWHLTVRAAHGPRRPLMAFPTRHRRKCTGSKRASASTLGGLPLAWQCPAAAAAAGPLRGSAQGVSGRRRSVARTRRARPRFPPPELEAAAAAQLPQCLPGWRLARGAATACRYPCDTPGPGRARDNATRLRQKSQDPRPPEKQARPQAD